MDMDILPEEQNTDDELIQSVLAGSDEGCRNATSGMRRWFPYCLPLSALCGRRGRRPAGRVHRTAGRARGLPSRRALDVAGDRPVAFGGDHVAGVAVDEMDVERVVVYRIATR
jgi:hypothetical protein